MNRKIYVGNLPFSINQTILQDTFSQCGTVDSIKLITDRITGQSKGFAFIEMSKGSEAQRAIQQLNGTKIDDRDIKVSEAKSKKAQNRSRGGNDNYQQRYR